jgi:hypothetical protein
MGCPMKATIGKYDVNAIADNAHGGFAGTAHYHWDEGGVTLFNKIRFEKVFATEDEAKRHALEQFEICVRDGAL